MERDSDESRRGRQHSDREKGKTERFRIASGGPRHLRTPELCSLHSGRTMGLLRTETLVRASADKMM